MSAVTSKDNKPDVLGYSGVEAASHLHRVHPELDYPGSNLRTRSNPKALLTVKRDRKPVASCTREVSGANRNTPLKQLVLLVFAVESSYAMLAWP